MTSAAAAPAAGAPGKPESTMRLKWDWYTSVATFVAGGIAGAASRTLTAPLDRIKILVQEGHLVQQVANHKNVSSLKRPHMKDVVKIIYEDGGLHAFWRGNGVNCLKAGPEFAIVFSLRRFFLSRYEDMLALEKQLHEEEIHKFIRQREEEAVRKAASSQKESTPSTDADAERRQLLQSAPAGAEAGKEPVTDSHSTSATASKHRQSLYQHLPHPSCLPYPLSMAGAVTHMPRLFVNFCIGASAGAGAQLVLYPLEVVKTRIVVSRSTEFGGGIREVVREAYNHGGISEFYRGLTPNMVGIFIFRGLEVGLYSYIQQNILIYRMEVQHKSRHDAALSSLETATAGMLASGIAQTVSYPLNVVRTRLQTQGTNGRKQLYDGMMDCFVKMVRQKGVSSLFLGLTANYLKALPASATTFVVFEKVQTLLIGDD